MVNLFKGPQYQSLIRDYETLIKLDAAHDDKLAINKGVLEISKGGFLQAPTRTVKNIIKGGYNRESVTQYLEELSNKTDQFVADLLNNPENIENSLADTEQYQEKVKDVATALSDIEFRYREGRKNSISKRLQNLYNKFSNINKTLENKIKEVKKKYPVDFRPPPVIDFDAPINIHKIIYMPAERVQPDDILHLAQNAEKQICSTGKKVAVLAIAIFSSIIISVLLTIPTDLKWIVWNPIEWIIKGEVTSKDPLDWWIDNILRWVDLRTSPTAQAVLPFYASKILEAKPSITDNHVKVFTQLIKYVKKVEFTHVEFGYNDIDKFMDNLEKEQPFKDLLLPLKIGKNAHATLSLILKGMDDKLIAQRGFEDFFIEHFDQLQWIDNPDHISKFNEKKQKKFNDWKNQFNGNIIDIEERKNYFIRTCSLDKYVENRTYITPDNLIKIIDAIGKEKNCRSFETPLGDNPIEIKQALEKYGFKQNPQYQWKFSR